MDSHVATIIRMHNGQATVSVDRNVVCARCAAGRGCGAGVFGSNRKPAIMTLQVPDSLRLQVGDMVNLTLQPAHLLRAALLVYGLPLIGIVLALLAGFLAAGSLDEAAAIVLAVVGLLSGSLAGRYSLSRNRCPEQFVPTISSLAKV